MRAAVDRDSLGLRHERTLVYSPHRWLVVIDDLQARREHRYEQWFHFSPNLSVALAEGGASVRGDDGSAFSVSPLLKREDTALRLVRGQKSPRLQGWTSLPAPTTGTELGPRRRPRRRCGRPRNTATPGPHPARANEGQRLASRRRLPVRTRLASRWQVRGVLALVPRGSTP